MNTSAGVGKTGEEIALQYLRDNGFEILNHHFTTHWGELDIVAKKGQKICFVEVKTRVGIKHGKPYEAVGYYKIKSLQRAIQYYLMKYNYKQFKYSLDVISIILFPDYTLDSIKYYENAYL